MSKAAREVGGRAVRGDEEDMSGAGAARPSRASVCREYSAFTASNTAMKSSLASTALPSTLASVH